MQGFQATPPAKTSGSYTVPSAGPALFRDTTPPDLVAEVTQALRRIGGWATPRTVWAWMAREQRPRTDVATIEGVLRNLADVEMMESVVGRPFFRLKDPMLEAPAKDRPAEPTPLAQHERVEQMIREPDYKEGVKAWTEKRPAAWTG